MIQAAEDGGAFHGPQIADVLDDANHLPVTLGIGAQRTDVTGVEIAAIGAVAYRTADRAEIIGKRQHQRFAILKKMQNSTAG